MNRTPAARSRSGNAAMPSGHIDLTTNDSSGSDSDVQIVGSNPLPQGTKSSQLRKTTPSGGSKHARQQPKPKSINAPTPRRNLKDTPVDLRSDTSSPRSSKPPRMEKVSDPKTQPRPKAVATKSAPPNPPVRVEKRSPGPFHSSASSEDELPDLHFKTNPSGSSRLPLQNQVQSDSFGSRSNALKRPLDTRSGSPATARPAKKARLDGPNNTGSVVSTGTSKSTRKDRTQPDKQKKLLDPSHQPVDPLSQKGPSSNATFGKKAPSSDTKRGDGNRPSSSPFVSNGVPPPKRPDPFADLQASQERYKARQQTASQEDGGKVSNAPKGATTSLSSRPKQSGNGLTPPAQSLPGNRPDRNSRTSPKDNKRKQAKTTTADPAAVRTSVERVEQLKKRPQPRTATSDPVDSSLPEQPEQADKRRQAETTASDPVDRSLPGRLEHAGKRNAGDVTSETSRALKLLNERSSIADQPRSKEKRAGSSEDDQGYVSLGSGSAEDHRQDARRDAASLQASPHQEVTDTSPAKPKDLVGRAKADASLLQHAELPPGGEAETQKDDLSENLRQNDKAEDDATRSTALADGPERVVSTDVEKPARSLTQTTAKENHLSTGSAKRQEAAKATEAVEKATQQDAEAEKFKAAADAAEADEQLQSEGLRAQSDSVFAIPQSAASTLKTTAAYAKLSLANKVEKVLGQYLEELAEDCEYWTSNSLMRARMSKELALPSTTEDNHAPTSFAHMKPLKLSPSQKDDSRELTWGFEEMAHGKPVSSEKVIVPRQTFTTDEHDVPSYAHYVSITNNILAQNVKTLHCWPYFGDDFPNSDADNLKEQYHLDIEGREQKLLRMRQAQKYEEYVESALSDLECSWADVLRFLLEPRPEVGSDSDAIKALDSRQEFCQEEFDRSSKRWVTVLSSLPPSTTKELARAAVLCETFQKLARFPLWHIARRSDLCKLPEREQTLSDVTVASDELTCRICMRFNCPYHGEMKEHADDESEDDQSDTSSVNVVATDLVHPPKVNYRTRMAFPVAQPSFEETDDANSRPAKKDLKYWQNFRSKADARGPFYPCSHPGQSCEDEEADCSCHADNLPCEKFCGCDKGCSRKFQGCSCSTKRIKAGKRGPCFEDERCTCWQLGRECDPDLCGGCGVCEVVDPVNKHDEDVPRGRCQHANLQRAVPKCTLLGDSGIHGLGLYACEDIQTHEFVGEYKGEIITKEEAERRGAVYEHQKLSYLFSLNSEQEIDSTYFGNKIRFINHAFGLKANLNPKIIMVNTVHRIGLYAARSIKKGEELLFDYGPQFPEEQLGGKKSKKSAPHVRNANLVKEFYRVEEEQDELGNMRAKGVSSGVGGRKAKQPKSRGGARPGAGRKPRGREPEQLAAVEPGAQHEDPLSEDELAGQDAGQRLAAYNVADDGEPSDHMDLDFDAVQGAAEEDDEEYQESEGKVESESEGGEESESSEEEGGRANGGVMQRPTRPSGRRSWRT